MRAELYPDYWFWRGYYYVYFWLLFNAVWPLRATTTKNGKGQS